MKNNTDERKKLILFHNRCRNLLTDIYNYWLNDLNKDKRYKELTLATKSLLDALLQIEKCIK